MILHSHKKLYSAISLTTNVLVLIRYMILVQFYEEILNSVKSRKKYSKNELYSLFFVSVYSLQKFFFLDKTTGNNDTLKSNDVKNFPNNIASG